MLVYLILLLTVVPVVELAVLIKIGQHIGVVNTLAIVVFTGITGAYLARSQGFAVLIKIQDDLSRGVMPTDKIFDGILILCGGILLLTPGIITDIMGFFMIIPFTRYLIKLWLRKKVRDMISRGQVIRINCFKSHG